MKVLLFNGSPHPEGCTFTALNEIMTVLHGEGIETELVQLGKKPIAGCVACGACRKLGKCAFGESDGVNEFIEKAKTADGFVFGAPVHYASIAGAASSFLDRVFYSASGVFAFKPGCAVVSCRRAGSTVSLDQLNKYFTISSMPVVSSCYWNMIHGSNAEQAKQDLEGMQIMRTLGRNMAWLLKSIEAGRAAGLELPAREPRVFTNFIR